MKKLLAMLMVVCMVVCVFTACGNKENAADANAVELNLQDVVTAIEETAPVTMAQEWSPAVEGSTDYLTDLFGLDPATVEDYYGKFTMVNTSSDTILLVKAVAGQKDAVVAALDAYRNGVAASQEMYLESEYLKAENGRVVTSGDYVLLVIAGDSNRIANGEVNAVYEEIDVAIDAALH